MRQAEMRLHQDVDSVIIGAVNNYGKKKGYNLILDSASPLYSDSAYDAAVEDVTKDLLTEVNALWRSMKKK
jgi:Skp family chaperone for outer membrane proteins